MKVFQAICASVLLSSTVLAGCYHPETPAEKEQVEKDRVDRVQAFQGKFNSLLHICDNNGGVKDYGTGRGSIYVTCTNGLSTYFYL